VGVELLSSDGGLPDYPPYPNSEYHGDYLGSQSAREKLRGREGNNPDRLLRSQSSTQSLRMLEYDDSRDVGLEAAII
jgi:hypothetical protein